MATLSKPHIGLHNLHLHRHHRLHSQSTSLDKGHLLHHICSPRDLYREIRLHVSGHTEALDAVTLEEATTLMTILQMGVEAAVGVMVKGADPGEAMEAEETLVGTTDLAMVAVVAMMVDGGAEILVGSATSCGICV
ncbi:MAG: hypothetical protein Pars2KO_33410 [Parasphingorhabdus sp.]